MRKPARQITIKLMLSKPCRPQKEQESFKHDPEVEVFIATARGARRRPHQLRHSQLQNRRPHQVWPASLLRGYILERQPSVPMLEKSQNLSKNRTRGKK